VITDPLFWALAVPAVLIAGISKGGFGGGVGIVATPMMAMAISPIEAAAIMLPILLVMDAVGWWGYRDRWYRPHMGKLIIAALIGTAAGALTFRMMDESAIRLLVGTLAVGFPLYQRSGVAERVYKKPPGWKAGFFWSTLSGYTSFIIHAGMPPFAIYLLGLKLQAVIYVGTTVIFFAIVNYAKILPYWWLDLLNAGNMLTAAVLIPIGPVGIWIGMWMRDRVPQKLFYDVVHLSLIATGAKLIWDGLAPWLA
jgi:uncharacterized membrane protein YfcA